MSYLEMLDVAEEHWNGSTFNEAGIRTELKFNWGFKDFLVDFYIEEMKNVGII